MTSPELEYVLGTGDRELERLRFQHETWADRAHELWRRAGLRGGQVALDLGCGPGFTSFALARFVGREGRVIARDQSARFLAALRAERDRLGLAQVETSEGPVERMVEERGVPVEGVDLVYARWFFCWLADPGAALATAARALRPGGAIAVQDYLDWGAMRLVPDCATFDRAVAACMRSWELGEGTIDVAGSLARRARRLGLTVERFEPVSRLGAVGSMEWRWLGAFFRSYLPKVVEAELLTEDDARAFAAEWGRRTEKGERGGWCLTPTMADLVLRKV